MAGKTHKALVIVESVFKAKKFAEWLGRDYIVKASAGHVRDLPSSAKEIPAEIKKESWSTLGVNVDNGFDPLYIVPAEKKKLVKELKDSLKSCSELIIATDEDREGESIGWHLIQLLEPKVPVRRMTFSEVTRQAALKAIQNTRELDEDLVAAQETRRVVDRLYGYRLSPLLWKKVAPGLSAGRVQSVAVRLLVQREYERMAFRKAEYWDLKSILNKGSGPSFTAMLATVDGQRVASGRDFDETTGRLKPAADVLLLDEAKARSLETKLKSESWTVAAVEQRQQVRKPYPPFTTSTLQQEANRKLSMSARETMQTAQRLYENGYITYMRTDSVTLSQEAITAARQSVVSRYGKEYLSPEPRQYSTKSKNAQEAHEAIRPAGTLMQTADELELSGREAALYAMIWKRTMATQMAEAQLRFQTVTLQADGTEFRATGRHVEFAGFFRAYVEGVDDPEAALDDEESALPPLQEGDRLSCVELSSLSHETKPPARYTEATIVGKLEAEGIGRPSTYATIIGTIIDRKYCRKVGNQLVPTFTGMAVTRLLEQHFPKLVDYGFTAQMEQRLDDISNGQAERLPYLQDFYTGADGLDEQVKLREPQIDPRTACTLEIDGLTPRIRVGRYGPYFESSVDGKNVTAGIPDDIAPADLDNGLAQRLIEQKQAGPQSLGVDPATGEPMYALLGPFGPYVQLGDVVEDGPKPKRVSLPKGTDLSQVTEEQAAKFLSLPRTLGMHPETGKPVQATIGRFGPCLIHEKTFKSIPKTDDVFSIDLARGVELLSQARFRPGATPIRELGPHPEDGQAVALYEGKYGVYAKHGDVNATIPKDRTPESLTLAEAVELLTARAAAGGGKKGARGRGRTAKGTTAARVTKKKVGASRAAPDDSDSAPEGGATKKPAAKKSAVKKAATGTKAAKKTATRKTAKKAASKKASSAAEE